MKISFVQPNGRTAFSICPEPPLGLAYLASSLLDYNKNLDIEIIDGFILSYDDYVKKLSELKADVIGVTSTTSLLGEAFKIPGMVKDKDAIFIIGGPGVMSIPSIRLHECGYSIICYGEGERTIVELIRAMEKGLPLKEIKGISFISKGEVIRTAPRELIENLDDIPFPARHLLDMRTYTDAWKKNMGVGFSPIISSRGCQFSCRFCSKSIFGNRIRFRSSQNIIEEMRELYDEYDVEQVFFEDDLFTQNRKRVLDFCDAMERELPGKKWGAMARVDTVDHETLSRMKQSGCIELAFGVESGSQAILELLKKGITVEQIKRTFKLANEIGIVAGMFLIVGIPGETDNDMDLTKNLIAECRPKWINIFLLTPLPGTEIHEMTKHLIREDVDFCDFNDSFGGAYKKEVFEVDPMERMKDIMNFYLEKFKGEIDPRFSIYDGSLMKD